MLPLTSSLSEREVFHVDKITVEDDSGTKVDEAVFAELCTMEGVCSFTKVSCNNGKFYFMN